MSYDFAAEPDRLVGTFTTAYDVPLTIACWMKKTAAQHADTNDNRLISLGNSTSVQNSQLTLRSAAADNIAARAISSAGSASEDLINFADTTYDDLWVLCVGVFTSDTSREVFIEDSTGGGPQTTERLIDTLTAVAIGGATHNGFLHATAKIAEVCMWNIALGDTDIDALQTAAQTGPAPNTIQSANVIGYWSLDEDGGAGIQNQGSDATGDLTVESAAPYSSDHPTITSGVTDVNLHGTGRGILRGIGRGIG